MSTALQKAIVYELFAIFLTVVICAAALAETIAAGYLTGPWFALALPALIALVGLLQALAVSGTSPDDEAGSHTNDDGDGGPDEDESQERETPVVGHFGHPPY